jgi:hypothetical protein
VRGYESGGLALTALPTPDHDLSAWEIRQATVTRRLEEGDVIDLGNRHFEVLHLPGHSPGSIGLWEAHFARMGVSGADRELVRAYLEGLDGVA